MYIDSTHMKSLYGQSSTVLPVPGNWRLGVVGQAGLLASRNRLQFKVMFLGTHSYVATKFLHLFLHSQEILAAAELSAVFLLPAACFLHTGSDFSLNSLAPLELLVLSSRGAPPILKSQNRQDVCAPRPQASPRLSHLTFIPFFSPSSYTVVWVSGHLVSWVSTVLFLAFLVVFGWLLWKGSTAVLMPPF